MAPAVNTSNTTATTSKKLCWRGAKCKKPNCPFVHLPARKTTNCIDVSSTASNPQGGGAGNNDNKYRNGTNTTAENPYAHEEDSRGSTGKKENKVNHKTNKSNQSKKRSKTKRALQNRKHQNPSTAVDANNEDPPSPDVSSEAPTSSEPLAGDSQVHPADCNCNSMMNADGGETAVHQSPSQHARKPGHAKPGHAKHQPNKNQSNNGVANASSGKKNKKKSNKACKFGRRCRNKRNCRFMHPDEAPPASSDPATVTDDEPSPAPKDSTNEEAMESPEVTPLPSALDEPATLDANHSTTGIMWVSELEEQQVSVDNDKTNPQNPKNASFSNDSGKQRRNRVQTNGSDHPKAHGKEKQRQPQPKRQQQSMLAEHARLQQRLAEEASLQQEADELEKLLKEKELERRQLIQQQEECHKQQRRMEEDKRKHEAELEQRREKEVRRRQEEEQENVRRRQEEEQENVRRRQEEEQENRRKAAQQAEQKRNEQEEMDRLRKEELRQKFETEDRERYKAERNAAKKVRRRLEREAREAQQQQEAEEASSRQSPTLSNQENLDDSNTPQPVEEPSASMSESKEVEDSGVRKQRWQDELRLQKERAAEKKNDKKKNRREKYLQEMEARFEERTAFWKQEIAKETLVVNMLQVLLAAEFCRKNRGFDLTREALLRDDAASEKLLVASQETYRELYKFEIYSRVVIKGTKQAELNDRCGTVERWEGNKEKYFVGLDTKKGKNLQYMYVSPGNLEALPLEPSRKKKKNSAQVHLVFVASVYRNEGLMYEVDKATVDDMLNAKKAGRFVSQLMEQRTEAERLAKHREEEERRQEEEERQRRAEQRRRENEEWEQQKQEYSKRKAEYSEWRREQRRASRRGSCCDHQGCNCPQCQFENLFFRSFGGGEGGVFGGNGGRGGFGGGGGRGGLGGGFFFRGPGGNIFFGFGDEDGYFDDDSYGEDEWDRRWEQMHAEDLDGKNQESAELLGVGVDAEAAEIKREYRKKALKYHPDKFRPENHDDGMTKEEAEEHFKHLTNAYDHLMSNFD